MQKSFDKSEVTATASSRFSLLLLIRFRQLADGLLCSPEHGKLCFEALETELVPQNNLPCWELKKRLPKSAFCVDLKMD